MTEIEKLVCAETPTTREEIGTTMTALRKPLKMWPGLYTILGPIRKLLDPDAPFEWGEEQSEAWAQAKKYVLKEFSPYTDSESDGGRGSDRTRHEKRNLTGAAKPRDVRHQAKKIHDTRSHEPSKGRTKARTGSNRWRWQATMAM